MKNLNQLVILTITFISFNLCNTAYSQVKREVGNMVLEDIPEIPDEIRSRIQQYQNTRSALFADWLPNNEGMLIKTRFGSTTQFHKVKKPGGTRNQITFFDEPVRDGFLDHQEIKRVFYF